MSMSKQRRETLILQIGVLVVGVAMVLGGVMGLALGMDKLRIIFSVSYVFLGGGVVILGVRLRRFMR